MRVAVVTARYHPYVGGVETHVRAISERLRRAGLEIDVYSTDPGGRLPTVESVDGVTVRRYRAWAPGDAYYLSPSLLVDLRRRAGGYDLVHAHSYQALSSLYGALAADGRRPFVFTPHYHGQGETLFRNLLHIPWRLAGRWLFRRADHVVCVSSAELARLTRRFPFVQSKASVIPNGVSVDGFRIAEPYPKCGRLILYVGRLERYKNIHRLVGAMRLLPGDCRLIIVGRGPYHAELLKQIGRLELGSRVEIKCGVSGDELSRWYKTADLCANLSSSEAFGITLLEALAAEKPVLASSIAAFRDVAKLSPAIRLIDTAVESDAGIATTLLETMSEAKASACFSSDLTGYTWDDIARRTLLVYEQVMGKKLQCATR